MKKQLTIFSLGLILAGSNLAFSQELIQPCNTYAAMEEHFAADPAAKVRYDAKQKLMHEEYLNYEKNISANKTTAVEYTIPVVFHILHQGGAENISDATCLAALKQVNDDFSRQGADTATIFAPFKALYINSDIKFMLAKKDPVGNCITGIVRHVDPKTNWSQASANQSSTSGNAYWPYTWDPTKYLNIYVVANIVPQGTVTGNGIIVGYTYRPNTWPTGNPHDAIVYRYNYLGAGAQASYQARSLSHEIGHWLNLAHTFGNTNNPGVTCGSQSGGDNISDTPDTKGNFSNCPASSTNSNVLCTSGATPYYQNVENIMDYSSCPKNFTTGQTNAMRAALASFNSGRNAVITTSNLSVSYTDVNGAGLCAPIAEFLSSSNTYTVCQGGTLVLKDFSYNSNITSYQWTGGAGAVFATPSATVTNATFNTVGATNVTLTVTSPQGSSTKVRTVTVLSSAAVITGANFESFENSGLPNDWSVFTTPSNSTSWQQAPGIALHAQNSFFVEGASATGGAETILQMPMVNLLSNPNCTLKFAYSYARKSSSHNDIFKVQFSKDCGGTWVDVVTKNASTMASETGGVQSAPYTPTDDSQWKVVDVTADYPQWYQFTNSASVLIRFNFEEAAAGGGNNFYLDAVDFAVIVGINELTRSIQLNMFPNPTTGETNLSFKLSDAAAITVNVVDVLGKNVLPPASYQMQSGDQNLVINKNNSLAKGVYFVNMTMNGAKMSRKLIVN